MSYLSLFFFFNDTATTEIYTLSLHDALPITIMIPAPVGCMTSSRRKGAKMRAARPETYSVAASARPRSLNKRMRAAGRGRETIRDENSGAVSMRHLAGGEWDPVSGSFGPARCPAPQAAVARKPQGGESPQGTGPALLTMTKLYCRSHTPSSPTDQRPVHRTSRSGGV